MLTYINTQQPVWNPHQVEYWTQVPQYEQLCHYGIDQILDAAKTFCPLSTKFAAWALKHDDHKKRSGLDFVAESNVSEAGVWNFRFGVSDGDGEKRGSDRTSDLLTFTAYPLEMPAWLCHHATLDSRETTTTRSRTQANPLRCIVQNQWLRNCL